MNQIKFPSLVTGALMNGTLLLSSGLRERSVAWMEGVEVFVEKRRDFSVGFLRPSAGPLFS